MILIFFTFLKSRLFTLANRKIKAIHVCVCVCMHTIYTHYIYISNIHTYIADICILFIFYMCMDTYIFLIYNDPQLYGIVLTRVVLADNFPDTEELTI